MPYKYPFAIDVLIDELKYVRAHRLLEEYQARFRHLDCTTFFVKELHLSILTTMEPDNIKSILATDFKSYSVGEQRKQGLRPILGDGIFTTDGAQWQHSRDMLRPCFVRSQIGDRDLFELHFQHLLNAVPRDGTTVDLQDLFLRLTLDITTEFLFGTSTHTLIAEKRRPEDDRFVEAFTYVQNSIENSSNLLALFLPDRRFRRNCKYVHDWVDALIERSLASASEKASQSTGRYVLLHELVAVTSDKVRIRTELLNMLLAGRDTTASLLSDVWWTISREPQVWSRLQKEVQALETPLGEERPIFEELKDMKYLRAVLNESLRLHPVVPANSRQAVTDTTLPVGGGEDGKSPVFVPKGTLVAYCIYAMHRRRDLFGEDANDFNPDRWLDDGEKKGLRVGWEYLPFNGGPRICIGQQFALTEASYITVRLLQEFDRIECRDQEVWREKIGLTCTGLGGCKVSLTALDLLQPSSNGLNRQHFSSTPTQEKLGSSRQSNKPLTTREVTSIAKGGIRYYDQHFEWVSRTEYEAARQPSLPPHLIIRLASFEEDGRASRGLRQFETMA
ncbi:MAG: hypothetical protein L6R40_006757 [Gallowayella cf. fulva]|nr:MAG: hypothetical protein L6R40_006757 [Xanthomendoza cf. fulva]